MCEVVTSEGEGWKILLQCHDIHCFIFPVSIRLKAKPQPRSQARKKALGTRLRALRARSDLARIRIMGAFSSLEVALLLVSTKNGDFLPDPIFWEWAEFSLRILSQSDLSDVTESQVLIENFQC